MKKQRRRRTTKVRPNKLLKCMNNKTKRCIQAQSVSINQRQQIIISKQPFKCATQIGVNRRKSLFTRFQRKRTAREMTEVERRKSDRMSKIALVRF